MRIVATLLIVALIVFVFYFYFQKAKTVSAQSTAPVEDYASFWKRLSSGLSVSGQGNQTII